MAPTNPPVTAVDATIEDLIAELKKDTPTKAVYIYLDDTLEVPGVEASDLRVAVNDNFPEFDFDTAKMFIYSGKSYFNDATTVTSAGQFSADTELIVKARIQGNRTNPRYEIVIGTLKGKFVNKDDVLPVEWPGKYWRGNV